MTERLAPLDIVVACLAAARSAAAEGDDTVASYYLATSRSALDSVSEQVERLRLNLRAVEKELVGRAPKKLEK